MLHASSGFRLDSIQLFGSLVERVIASTLLMDQTFKATETPLFCNRNKSRIYDQTTLSFEIFVAKESLKHFEGLLDYSRFAQTLPKKATVVASGTLLVTSNPTNFSKERLSFT
jgi:hypothetical protein